MWFAKRSVQSLNKPRSATGRGRVRNWLVVCAVLLGLFSIAAVAPVPDILVKGGTWYDVRLYTTLNAAITAVGGAEKTVLVLRTETIADDTTVPATVDLWLLGGGSFSVDSGKTLDLSATTLCANTTRQIFTGSGTVVPTPGQMKLEWFGTFTDATTLIGANEVGLTVETNIAIDADTSVASTMAVEMIGNGRFTIASSKILVLAGAFHAPRGRQVFYGDGFARPSALQPMQCNWWPSFAKAVEDTSTNSRVLEIVSQETISDTTDVPATLGVRVLAGGQLNAAALTTLTLRNFEAPPVQVFAGNGTVVFGRFAVPEIVVDWFGTTSTAIQAAFDARETAGDSDYRWRFTPGSAYTISATVDCALGDRCVVDAEGASFSGTLDDDWFELYSGATIIREAHWRGGYYENSGANTAAVCFQVSDVREGSISGVWTLGFYTGIQFYHMETFTIERNFLRNFTGYAIRFATASPDDEDLSWNSRNMLISRNGISVTDAASSAVSAISLEHRNENARIVWNTIDCNFSGPAIYVVDATAGATHGSKPYGVLEICGNHLEGIATSARTPRTGIHIDDPAGLGYGGVRVTGNHFGSSSAPYTVTFIDFERVTSGYVGENYFYASGTDVDVTSTALDLDANCTEITLADTNQYNLVDTKITAACARSEFTIEPEIRQVACDLVGYNSDAKATGNYTIDMSTAMAGSWPSDAVPKGYWVVMYAEDSSSATGGDTDCYLKLKEEVGAGAISSVQLYLGGVTNGLKRSSSGYVAADDNGDIYLSVAAKGTMTVWIGVQAYDM